MNFNSKKTSLLILGVTAVIFSRTLFSFFNDPEGPNLLIVMGMAAIIYLLSLAVYFFVPLIKQGGLKKLLLLILVQILIVTALYFSLR